MKQEPLTRAVCWAILACICIAAAGFMLYASFHEAPIVDEDAHIPAGYGYVHELSYDLNPEHPPLVKAIAAAPLLAFNPTFPTDNAAWTTALNGQWDMGSAFLYHSGNNADLIVRVARMGPILLTLLFIVFLYWWARKLLGPVWALLPAFLFAFSPTVLAHGHYVTTDIGAAFGVLFSTYFYLKSLRTPSWKSLVMAGIALGLAELAKFSTVLVPPFFCILAAVHFLLEARVAGARGKQWWLLALKRLAQLVAVFIMAGVVIYTAYFLFTLHYPIAKQVSDTHTILLGMAEGGGIMGLVAKSTIWMAGTRALRPLAEYLLGVLMVVVRASGGNTAYFLGHVSNAGSHLYFPVVYALKESLPALFIILIAFLGALGRMGLRLVRRETKTAVINYLHTRFAEFALILFACIYWGYSIRSNLNIGVRHLMPVIPIMYLLAAVFWRSWVMGFRLDLGSGTLRAVWSVARSVFASSIKLALLILLVGWVMLETFLAAPYFLSYFNELAGGTWNGYHYVTDSNYDWGQDVLRLRDLVNAHPEIDKIAVDTFGAAVPSYYLGNKEVDWHSDSGDPRAQGIHWVAISVNFLENALQPSDPVLGRREADTYPWLTSALGWSGMHEMGELPAPTFRAGTSIFVYHLP